MTATIRWTARRSIRKPIRSSSAFSRSIGKGDRRGDGPAGGAKGLSPAEFTDEKFGVPTVRDILAELEKPGRDPRPEFKTATFQEGVESSTRPAARHDARRRGDQRRGVRRVRRHRRASGRPGARVGTGERFIKDPHEVVKPGQIVKVKVLEVDVKRQRIALTMRLDDAAGSASSPDRAPIAVSAGASRESRDRRPSTSQRAPERQPTANRHDGHGTGACARQTEAVASRAVCLLTHVVLCRERTRFLEPQFIFQIRLAFLKILFPLFVFFHYRIISSASPSFFATSSSLTRSGSNQHSTWTRAVEDQFRPPSWRGYERAGRDHW